MTVDVEEALRDYALRDAELSAALARAASAARLDLLARPCVSCGLERVRTGLKTPVCSPCTRGVRCVRCGSVHDSPRRARRCVCCASPGYRHVSYRWQGDCDR